MKFLQKRGLHRLASGLQARVTTTSTFYEKLRKDPIST